MNPEPSFSEQLAKYYLSADSTAIPKSVLDQTKQIIIDYLGCAIGGADAETTRMIKKIFTDGAGNCAVFNGEKATVERAAFINAAASHTLELDDSRNDAGGHPAVVVIPAAMAMAEEVNAGGSDFIYSVLWGYDMMTRVGKGVVPENCFGRGWHPTATNGIFGATLATGLLLKLNEKQLANAWGIAYGFASGNLECYADNTLTKRLNPANAARGATDAARLALVGYSGPRWCFEGKHGYFTAFTDDPEPVRMLENMDFSDYAVTGVAFKPHACCRLSHSPIDSVIKIMRDEGLKADNIDKVVIDVCQTAVRAVVEPRELKYDPCNIAGAQFSLPYSVACAALFGDVSVTQFTEEKLRDKNIRDFMKKVEMIKTGEMDAWLPDIFAATAEIFTKDGRRFKELTKFSKGEPSNPMTVEEIKNKFLSLAVPAVGEKRATEIYDAVTDLDKITSIRDFTELL
ncbi:MAG: MmgE/PrpD family protein [Oscillospiraceae bacterium]|nr:MmgE/PrpD family protein [Oscillospiraceae bacterium]